MVYHRVKFLFLWEIPMQNMRTTSFEAITWWPIEISVKFQKRLIANQGSPIGWSRDQWSRVVTWPTFWKLGQGTAQKCDVSRSPMEISEKFQKRLIGNQGSPIGWSRDQWSRVVTWPTFWKLGQGTAQKCDVSRSPMEISEKFQKRLIANHGVADRMVTWPVISGGHVTYFLETRSRYSTKMWHISVTDGDISKKTKSYFSPILMLGNSRVIFHVVTAITLLSLIRNIKQQILMQKLLRSSNMSCSKPFITLLKQQISNCCSGKKYTGNAMHCLCT